MPNIQGTTRAQTRFLRAFATDPAGPPPQQWPAPAILRKWLKRPRFRAALRTLRDTAHIQADFHLTTAALAATRQLHHALADQPATPEQTADQKARLQALSRLLQLAHQRQRSAPQVPPLDIPELISQLSRLPPGIGIHGVIQFLERRHMRQSRSL